MLTVVNLGGKVLADAGKVEKIRSFIDDNRSTYRVIVVAPPGKRFPVDETITELLYRFAHAPEKLKSQILEIVIGRFSQIVRGLHVSSSFNVGRYFLDARKAAMEMPEVNRPDYLVSRGSNAMALILSYALNYGIFDAKDFIEVNASGDYNLGKIKENYTNGKGGLKDKLTLERKAPGGVVIPSSYGYSYKETGYIKLFPRGRSNVTGDIMKMITGGFYKDVPNMEAIGHHRTSPVRVPQMQ
ncbi:MAG: hypothetical protein AAB587_00340 [Patescibacteria group bacterium]